MIDTVIFDMDGVIIDSEPFWRHAGIIIFGKLGIELTDEMCRQTTGLGTSESIEYWFRYKPWKNKPFDEIKEEIYDLVMEQVEEQGTLNPGVLSLLHLFENKGVKIGLASSSPLKMIDLVVTKLGIKNRFQVLRSSEQDGFGKPHPGVYMGAVSELGTKCVNALAFEDSFNGLLSAKSAQMKAVAVLEPQYFSDTRFDFADLKLRSLDEFTEEHFEKLNKI